MIGPSSTRPDASDRPSAVADGRTADSNSVQISTSDRLTAADGRDDRCLSTIDGRDCPTARNVIAAAGYRECFIHGAGHHLGLQVHDANPDDPMKEAAVVTVEPGICTPTAPLGTRIEDDLKVTAKGPRQLTASIPKTIADIERAKRDARKPPDAAPHRRRRAIVRTRPRFELVALVLRRPRSKWGDWTRRAKWSIFPECRLLLRH
jgi:hypothetical protein